MRPDDTSKSPFQMIGYSREGTMPYACKPEESRGRLVEERDSPARTPFQRDRDRIIHSTAFRRLKHKTQVFIYHEDDHFRTRLTHTIEVAQIARSLARALRVDEDLAEALALAHDLGHPPFGHAGEDALFDCMKDHHGFEHNGQTLRIVTALERRYADFDGLNLCWETLEGIAKHNGPLLGSDGRPCGKYAACGLPPAIVKCDADHALGLDTYASLEAQCAAIADDIAYNAHDIDDGLREGLFTLNDMKDLPVIGELLAEVRHSYPNLDPVRSAHELIRRVITKMIEDVIATAQQNISKRELASVIDVRNAGHAFVTFSDEMMLADRGIKAYLMEHMYRTAQMMDVREKAEMIVRDLFNHFSNNPSEMANNWGMEFANARSDDGRFQKKDVIERVCDYVAGMTDRFAVKEHRRLFDVTPNLR